MSCYKLVEGKFQEAPDPISGDGDYDECIRASGYFSQATSHAYETIGAHVEIYQTNDADKPQYYIDFMGSSQQIACLVADDFPGLISTLKEAHSLVSLMGLDQQASIYMQAALDKEAEKRRGHSIA